MHSGADDIVVVHGCGGVDDHVIAERGTGVHHRSVHDQDASAHGHAGRHIGARTDGVHQCETEASRPRRLTQSHRVVADRHEGMRMPQSNQPVKLDGLVKHRNAQNRLAVSKVQTSHDVMTGAQENVDDNFRMAAGAKDQDRFRTRHQLGIRSNAGGGVCNLPFKPGDLGGLSLDQVAQRYEQPALLAQ